MDTVVADSQQYVASRPAVVAQDLSLQMREALRQSVGVHYRLEGVTREELDLPHSSTQIRRCDRRVKLRLWTKPFCWMPTARRCDRTVAASKKAPEISRLSLRAAC